MVRFRITHSCLVLMILLGGFASGCSMIRSDTLENAVRSDDPKKIQNHLDADANVNQTNENGQTPLHLAAQKGYKEVAGMLIGSNANVEAKDKEGRTPLHLAAMAGEADMVDYLTDKGASLSSQDNTGQSALHYAVLKDEYDVAYILLL